MAARNVTAREAQAEHDFLRNQRKTADQHEAARWRNCKACLRRMKNADMTVDGKRP